MTEQIINEIEDIRTYVISEFDKEPTAYVDRLQMLTTYIARTGVLLAMAKCDYNNAVSSLYEIDEKLSKLSPNQAKQYINAKCSNELYWCDLLDRLNASCVHQSENLRTLISYSKMEMQMCN